MNYYNEMTRKSNKTHQTINDAICMVISSNIISMQKHIELWRTVFNGVDSPVKETANIILNQLELNI